MAWQMSLRRLLGLFAFAYVVLHLIVWLALDHFFDWHQMGTDIAKRPYIALGMAALLCLLPLAATSTSRMVKRLGAPAWRRLHRLAYAAGILASLHFVWLAKVGRTEQYLYAAILALLLGVRLWYAARRRMRNWVARPREIA
jgi:sulfoxide reductase heme-binding subunit YedZ